MDGTMATIIMFAGNFAPRNWLYCQGQILAINSNTALFSLLGTTYGGDGRTSFGLPDMRGRVAIGVGHGPGLSNNYQLGQRSGGEEQFMTIAQMPAHNHPASAEVAVATGNGDSDEPDGNVLAATEKNNYAVAASANGKMGGVTASAGSTGGGQPFSIMQPFLVMNYVICINGVFPSRS